ncbi:MAG TPA: glutamate--tRNA ligase [Salinisphaeraceae bacterium]|nr:glutamate--tRNA ligase [Salinisphaeraceae bacterium]
MSVVTRFAPSPTGYLHIGGARTALYAWLHARQAGGQFRLRIEDTDRERSTEQAVQAILDSMAWLGLAHDGELVYQTARFARYQALIQQLLDEGKAYYCYCSIEELEAMRARQRAAGEKPRYDGTWRPMPGKTLPEPPAGVEPVVRFASPLAGDTVIHDLIKGAVTVANSELDDLIIARADGTPTYNFCVVVDDLDMGITHVIRGDDHVNNTPRQINIYKALAGADTQLPVFAHVPMILGADGKRLSKRHGAVGVMRYREQGYLPEALLNYLARLGWSHGDQEIFSIDELLQYFDITTVQGGAATFDPDKLLWVNHEHIRNADPERVAEELAWHCQRLGLDTRNGPALAAVVRLQRERCHTVAAMAAQSAFLFADITAYDDKAVAKFLQEQGLALLADARARLAALGEWSQADIGAAVKATVKDNKVGFAKVAQPLRIAVTGSTTSPSIDQTLALLGQATTVARIDAALAQFG